MLGAALVALAPVAWALGPAAAGASPPAPTTAAAPALADAALPAALPGYTLTASGPLTTARFASYAPDPAAAVNAFDRLADQPGFETALRSWTRSGQEDAVVDALVAFPTAAAATAYVAGQRAVLRAVPTAKGSAVPGVPGGRRVTFLIASPTEGIEQVVTFTSGRTAATVSLISADGPANTAPLTPAVAAALSARQYRLLAASPFGAPPGAPGGSDGARRIAGWAALGLAALGLVAVVVLLARRRPADRRVAAPVPVPGPAVSSAQANQLAVAVPATVTVVRPAPAPETPGAGHPVPPAGWYADPRGGGGLRYWNGTAWTGALALPQRA